MGAWRKSTCGHYGVPSGILERFAMGIVKKEPSSPKALEAVAAGVQQQLSITEDRATQAKRLQLQLVALATRKSDLFSGLTKETLSFFEPQIQKLMEEEKTLNARLAQVQATPRPPLDKKAAVTRALELYKTKVLTLEGPCKESIREVFRALGLRNAYGPDRKEGWLGFHPFGQLASKQKPPTAA